ncbi:hypothetical protein GN956_G9890 [Arapaima gigas]
MPVVLHGVQKASIFYGGKFTLETEQNHLHIPNMTPSVCLQCLQGRAMETSLAVAQQAKLLSPPPMNLQSDTELIAEFPKPK